MMDESSKIIGTCPLMCPISECTKRQKNKLIHILETGNEEEGSKYKMIKSYSRSAAGQYLNQPELLRPYDVLIKTINHLLSKTINDNRVTSTTRYDFINDRLRSVKQDAVIQRFSAKEWSNILPPIIKFYAFSAYYHLTDPVAKFDQKLNNDQLRDSISLFISNDGWNNDLQLRSEIEAFYLIQNNDTQSINRAILLDIKETVFKDVLNVILLLHRKRFFKVFKLLEKLPILYSGLFCSLYLSKMRKEILKTMSCGYNSKNTFYPADVLSKLMFYNTIVELIEDCTFYNIPLSSDKKYIQFTKISFNINENLPRKINVLHNKLIKHNATTLFFNNEIET